MQKFKVSINSAAPAITPEVCASMCGPGSIWPGLNPSPSLTDSNFAALWPIDPLLPPMERSNPV